MAALTAPTAEGAVYEVDMRLRPSGRQGPVAVSLAGFASYQLEEAWTWEHLALTRARVVAGPTGLQEDVEAAIKAALCSPHDEKKVVHDAGRMRARLLEARPEASAFEVKSGPGRMQDIELVLQAGMLLCGLGDGGSPRRAIPHLVAAKWLPSEAAEIFADTLKLCFDLQQIGRVADGEGFSPGRAGLGLERLVLSVTGQDDLQKLEARCENLFIQAFESANKLIPLVESD